MPYVTSIGALMAIVFLAALVSGWIAAGSPRIAYVGFQVAFAFFLCVIQGAAPAFDMAVARDRVIGILFGNLVVALVFTLIWPVSVADRVDPALTSVLRSARRDGGGREPGEALGARPRSRRRRSARSSRTSTSPATNPGRCVRRRAGSIAGARRPTRSPRCRDRS